MVDLNSLVSGLSQLGKNLADNNASQGEKQTDAKGGAPDLTKLLALISTSDIAKKAPEVMTTLQEILAKFGKGDIKELVGKACGLISQSNIGENAPELIKTLQGLIGKND